MAKFMICPSHEAHEALHAINLDHVCEIEITQHEEHYVVTASIDAEDHVLFQSDTLEEATARFYEIVSAASPEIVTTTSIREEPPPQEPE